ncbi:MAG: hypothetical protein HYX29_05865 [Solirubrobacterales bacterium]|nr:hypothetical protein [Solirubrobacterales bacterium]
MRNVKIILFVAIFALGLATIIVTLANGGTLTSRGILFGGILCAMAALRIFLALKHNA